MVRVGRPIVFVQLVFLNRLKFADLSNRLNIENACELRNGELRVSIDTL